MTTPKAFEELVVRYQGAVCAVAYAILRDRARSEEVAQEAFLIAWQKLPAITPAPALPAWVCGIARNLARNAARRPKEMPMTEFAEPVTSSPVDLMIDRERQQLAEQALAQLDIHEREAIVLYYRGDGSIADVATTLGITEPAARKRLQRGRDHLKSALAGVEQTLRATRPGPAFTAACVAALAAGGVGTAEAATSAARPATKLWLAAPIAAIVVGGVAAIAASSGGTESPSPEPTPAIATIADARTAHPDSAFFKRITRPDRTAMLDKIHSARRVGDGGGGATELGATIDKTYDFSGDVLTRTKLLPPQIDPLVLNKATIRLAITDVLPLLLECYTEAFDRLPRKDGTLEVRLVLVGEPGLATLVDTVELGGDAHLTSDAAFGECMRETLYTIELPAMTASETWAVNYPFTMPGKK